ncbi:glycosyltransferase family 15 protein [Amylostereum chailletii]|nr:glycosyltransferase family 15 protein [Amylostereum chailletii]
MVHLVWWKATQRSYVSISNISADSGHNGHLSPWGTPLANATLLMLCRNSDMDGVLSSMSQLEMRFNHRFGYPWIILNDQPFTQDFKTQVIEQTNATVSFGLISREHWEQPEWIDEQKASAARKSMSGMMRFVPYGGSISYRNMCRFNSGFFFRHDLLLPYKYYWRVEPDVQYFCDIQYDPFVFMQEHNKTYGFIMSMREYLSTIPTLWENVKGFMRDNHAILPPNNTLGFISEDLGETYNLCHYWSNFEIADMDFWRSDEYTRLFEYLDRKGGFYYERWGDAPVHTIAASLFLRKEQIHFFRDIGYRHEPFERCPVGEAWEQGRCTCDPQMTFDTWSNSCLGKWEEL